MRKLLALLLVVSTAPVVAQTATELAAFEKLPWPNTFALGYFQATLPQVPTQHVFGYNGEYLIGSKWGIEWSVAGGDKYLHAGFGSIVGPIIILLHNNTAIKSGPMVILVTAAFTAAEQTNFHIPIVRGLELVPFVSLYKFRSIQDIPGYPVDGTASWSVGMKVSLTYREKWFANFVAEAGRLYHEGTPSIVLVGVSIGFFSRPE